MIGVIFKFGSETVETRIDGINVFFRTSQFQQFGDIDGVKLDKVGVIEEFPDLEGNVEWEKEARERFKDKIASLPSERERAEYLIQDLSKHGYVPLYLQRQGFRAVKL